ncbi:MAG: hypothetical protein AAF840_13515, partial [Bacteroidota bacterium]
MNHHMITAVNQSSLLPDIRATVASKDGDIPFLLLPVRLEARFMKVSKPTVRKQVTVLSEVLAELADLKILITLEAPEFTARQRAAFVQDFSRKSAAIQRSARKLGGITRQEKHYFEEMSAEVETALLKAFPKPIRGIATSTHTTMVKSARRIRSAAKRVKETPDTSLKNASNYLRQVKGLVREVALLAEGNIPFTTKRKKKDLYHHVEGVMDRLSDFYRAYDDKVEDITNAKKNQVSRLKTLNQQLSRLTRRLPRALRKIHRDSNYQAFVDRIEARIKGEVSTGIDHFEHTILPKLEYVAEIPHVPAIDLYYRGIKTLLDLELVGKGKPIKGATQLRASRKKLRKSLGGLRRMSDRVLEGSPEQVAQIEKLWQRIDGSAAQLNTRLTQVRPDTLGRAGALAATQIFLSDNLRPSLNISSVNFAKTATAVRAEDFATATNHYLSTSRQLDTLNQGGAVDQGQLEQLANHMKIASRKHLPMTAPQLSSLNSRVVALEEKIVA